MLEQICQRCRRVCFSDAELLEHNCENLDDKLDAEISLAEWDGLLPDQE